MRIMKNTISTQPIEISIIIPQYNGADMLRNCISSLFRSVEYCKNQDMRIGRQIELIVIDNASTDHTAEVMERICSEDHPFERILFFRNIENAGFAKAVNQGIRAADGEYVILLNNDTLVEEAFLYALVSCIEKDDGVFSASAMMRMYHDRELVDDAGDIYCLPGWAIQRGHGRPASSYQKSCNVFSACGGAAIYRRGVFEEIGYFDEAFFAYMEDVDIGYRARIHGYRNIYCPQAVVYHIGSATSGSRYNAFKIRLAARNNLYVPFKNQPPLLLLLHFPLLTAGFLIKYLFFCLKGHGRDFRAGIAEGLCSLRRLQRTNFQPSHLKNHLHIEGLLIGYTLHAAGRAVSSLLRRVFQSSKGA